MNACSGLVYHPFMYYTEKYIFSNVISFGVFPFSFVFSILAWSFSCCGLIYLVCDSLFFHCIFMQMSQLSPLPPCKYLYSLLGYIQCVLFYIYHSMAMFYHLEPPKDSSPFCIILSLLLSLFLNFLKWFVGHCLFLVLLIFFLYVSAFFQGFL